MPSFEYLRELPTELRRALEQEAVASDQVAAGGYVSCTTGLMNIYGNSVTGNDANDGLSPSTPKKTGKAVADLLATYFIKYNVIVNLRGYFTLSGYAESMIFDGYFSNNATVIIDGGPEIVVVNDNSGLNYTVSGGDEKEISQADAVWSVDEFEGKMIQILTGPATGETRTIQKNAAGSLVPSYYWSVYPGTGSKFRIIRPATTISGSGGAYFGTFGRGKWGSWQVQNLYLTGPNIMLFHGGDVTANVSHVIVEATVANARWRTLYEYTNWSCWRVDVVNTTKDVVAWDYVSLASVSFLATGPGSGIQGSYYMGTAYLAGVVIKTNYVSFLQRAGWIQEGTRIDNIVYYWSCMQEQNWSAIDNYNYTHCPRVMIEKGIMLTDSFIVLGGSYPGFEVTINNPAGHAIELINSRLTMPTGIKGLGAVGGLYVHDNSMVKYPASDPPTVTGTTAGDVTLDGAVQKSTWAAITGGTPINALTVGNNEFCIVKAV